MKIKERVEEMEDTKTDEKKDIQVNNTNTKLTFNLPGHKLLEALNSNKNKNAKTSI